MHPVHVLAMQVINLPPVGGGVLFSGDFFLSFFVSLSATLRQNGWTDLHEIFRDGVEWPWDDLITFWVNSGKRVGGSKVNLFVITDHSSEKTSQLHSLGGSRGGACCASHHSLLHYRQTNTCSFSRCRSTNTRRLWIIFLAEFSALNGLRVHQMRIIKLAEYWNRLLDFYCFWKTVDILTIKRIGCDIPNHNSFARLIHYRRTTVYSIVCLLRP